MRQKIFFLQKKIQNGRLKKRSFFNSVNSQYFFVKISWIGPWASRIDWCEGHWYDREAVLKLKAQAQTRPKTQKSRPYWFIFSNFFCFIPMKISHKLCVRMDRAQFFYLLCWFTAKYERGNDKRAWVYNFGFSRIIWSIKTRFKCLVYLFCIVYLK